MATQLPPSQKNGTAPTHFSAHVYCGQTAGWIKIPLGTEVGLGPGNVVLDGDPAPPKRGTAPAPVFFSPRVLRLNGRMDEDATGYGSRPCPKPHCVRRGPSYPLPRKRHSSRLFSGHIYCGHGRPSQLLLSSCCVHCMS